MATHPLAQFLTNFASAYTGVSNLRGDPIREAQFGEDIRRYNEAAPQRAANLRFVEAQAEGMEMTNQVNRRAIAGQQFAEAELRANELGGLTNALGDPVFKQRLITAVNTLGEEAGEDMQIADYARLNRQNAEQWGLSPEQYEQMLTQRNPGHVPGQEDDEILVPLYKQRDGSVAPLDVDGDGTMDTWSAQEAVEMIRGAFVGSDEYARAMGSLYTGQPGAGAGGGMGGNMRFDANENLAPPPELAPVISGAAERHGVPANVLAAIIHQESRYNPNAVNAESGATGIAQYMPETAQSLGIDPRDPQQAIDATAKQLAEQLRNGQSMQEAVMHHFAGPDRSGWGSKTMEYGQEVMAKAALMAGQSERTTPRQRQEAISAEALQSANQVAAGTQEGEQQGTVEFLPYDPGNPARQNLPPSLQTIDDLNNKERKLFANVYSGEAAEAASVIPPVEGESSETVLGVPKEAMPENPSRGARRVAEGKGISPAQAKALALDPSELPAPTPRATVAAGYEFLNGLEDDDTGGVFTSRGGGKPTHKQLTTAVILNRAGMLDSDSLARYADLGVISASGVSVIQTGMQQVGQNQRQQMANQTSTVNTMIRQQGQTLRAREKRAAEAQDEAPTYADTLEQNRLVARTRLEAQGMPTEMAEERSARIAAKTTRLAHNSRAFQRADWENPRLVDAVAELEAFDQRRQDTGFMAGIIRSLRGQNINMNLSENPLAVLLHAEDSPIMEIPDEPGFWGKVLRADPGVETLIEGFEDAPRFVQVIHEPMISAATQAGALDMVENNPDLQMRIYDAATIGVRAMMQEEGRGILNDDEAISRAVMEATQAYVEALKGGGY